MGSCRMCAGSCMLKSRDAFNCLLAPNEKFQRLRRLSSLFCSLQCQTRIMLGTTYLLPLVATTASLFNAASGAVVTRQVAARDSTPNLPYDPNTSSFCVWWIDLSSPADCSAILSESFLTLEQFRRWVSALMLYYPSLVNNERALTLQQESLCSSRVWDASRRALILH
jgi:hypothetical protein